MKSPEAIVKGMLDNDAFSQLLGMQVKELGPGFCTLSCPVSAQTTNGFGIAHGGLTYSLADSALAFAANTALHAPQRIEQFKQAKTFREKGLSIQEQCKCRSFCMASQGQVFDEALWRHGCLLAMKLRT
jgi:hypothetical protein